MGISVSEDFGEQYFAFENRLIIPESHLSTGILTAVHLLGKPASNEIKIIDILAVPPPPTRSAFVGDIVRFLDQAGVVTTRIQIGC